MGETVNKSGQVLSNAGQQQVLYQRNNVGIEDAGEKCIHEVFEEQVEKTPAALAVKYEDRELTYGELNRQANQLAHYLRSLGVKPEGRVAICAERGLEMIVGLLGILKAGGAYLPLDPAYPQERLQYLLKDSQPLALLTQPQLREQMGPLPAGPPVLHLADAFLWKNQPQSNPEAASVGLTAKHLAYVIYTSGSTGMPKGVMNEHAAVVNGLVWARSAYGIESADRVLQKTTFSFDVSVWEFMLPLFSGAVLVMARPLGHLDPQYLANLLHSEEITTVFFVPSALEMFLELELRKGSFPRLRRVLCSGEALPYSLQQRFALSLPGVELHNLYGPTEAAVHVTAWRCQPGMHNARVPIGCPIANLTMYILDDDLQPVHPGAVGELYIGGAGVARGYWNRSDLTAERFLQDPFVQDGPGRMYRTGDLGRSWTDGTIEFIGRNDAQVKIRGFRIELGEIESALKDYPGIKEGVIIGREEADGEKRLVAYYTAAERDGEQGEGKNSVSAAGMRSYLAARLPEYMVPAAYVRMEQMPLTGSGKLDRTALPAPEAEAYVLSSYQAPEGDIETVMADIWAELLHLRQVGRHDNFFALGGHSLLAARAVTRIRQVLRVVMTVDDLFGNPVLADLARRLKDAPRAELPPILRAERRERFPLSLAQQRLWFLAQMNEVSRAYHVPMGLHLKGELDLGALRRTLDRIVARHEALRTTFLLVDGEPLQNVASAAESRFHLLERDLRRHGDAKTELSRLLVAAASASFDLQTGPLIRGILVRESEDEYTLLITMHHIVSDGWSIGVFRSELSKLYTAFRLGHKDPLPELAVQYADYAMWEQQWLEGEVLGQQCAYWKRVLQGAPTSLDLPTDLARPAQQDYTGAIERLVLEHELSARLKELSWRQGTTLYMTLLAGWAALLSRLSGQAEVVIGTPVANRERPEIEGLIGFFVNTLALRVEVSGQLTVKELLKRVREVALGAQQNHNLPFERVVATVRPERSLAHNPLFQASFNWQNTPEETILLPGVEARPLESIPYHSAKFDLALSLQEVNGTIVGDLEYATSLFEPGTINRYLSYSLRLLRGMAADERELVERLNILSERERQQVLYAWNEAGVEYPSNKCIHELFAEQVDRVPDAVAVEYENQRLTYRDLNRQANQLAHYLRTLGVKEEARVAICVERGLEMIVGLLGILKAGGAYVPLDPAYPQQRLQYMLNDSQPVALLTQRHLREGMGPLPTGLPTLDLTDVFAWSNQPESNPEPARLGPTGHLAYVIYTSGSTGQPKGVLIEHANVARLFAATDAWFHFNQNDVWTLFHSYAFDFSVWEMWGALMHGGRLIVVDRDTTRSAEDFYRLVCRKQVTILNQTPSAFRQLIAAQGESGEEHGLRLVIFGGDTLDVAMLRPWWERKTNHQTHLVNMYGITETTVHVTYRSLQPADAERGSGSPIGRRIPDLRTYILNEEREPVPVGATGELYIGGAGLARGYLRRPQLTAERFVPDPYSAQAGARMYKTGDVGRWQADGNIEFAGRNDHQVKIRGFRVELGEIAARLREHPAVRDAVVVVWEDGPGEKSLVAYYSLHASREEPSLFPDLRSFVGERLPKYMVPPAYVLLESFPLTQNGKLDRKALPPPPGDAYGVHRYVRPQGDLETALAAIWAEVLKLERVGRHDDFFELGGHSLLALRVLSRVNDCFQIGLSVRTLLEHSMLMEFAQKLCSIAGRPVEELEKIAGIWLRVRGMGPEELKAALAVQ